MTQLNSIFTPEILGNFLVNSGLFFIIVGAVIFLGLLAMFAKWYKKPIHGKALVKTGKGGTKVAFDTGFFVIPILHKLEIMDITLKRITISRIGQDGLICKDNMRADIKVAFFVRVNNTIDDVKKVAYAIGCERASNIDTLETLFDAKFSEALKAAGKKTNFVDLYNERTEFRKSITAEIMKDLNGYTLEDCAIDYLEQTPLASLKQDNILDSEGIKKIIELTSAQQILANKIENDKDKTIKKQDVEARETILQYEKQLAEKEETQKKEIANIEDEQHAAIKVVSEKQLELAEKARLEREESIEVAAENKERQVIVAQLNKERTAAVEGERVQKDKEKEIIERERIITLADINKNKEVELENAKIQEIIRERVKVEKDVVIEQEKMKDTTAFATAERSKSVAITKAEEVAEEALVKQIKSAEANMKASEINGEAVKITAEFDAKKKLIEADAVSLAAVKHAQAEKTMAEALAAKESALGKAEAQVIEAKAVANLKDGETNAKVTEMNAIADAKRIDATAKAEADALLAKGNAEASVVEKTGIAEAEVIEKTGLAEAEAQLKKGTASADVLRAKGLSEAEVTDAKAAAHEKQGLAEAKIIEEKLLAEAKGVESKAEAMRKLDGVGKEHEEFKLQLQKDKDIEIAQIGILADIAKAQASVIAEAMKSAKIDIVGGDAVFFDKIAGSVMNGKTIDTLFANSKTLTGVKDRFLTPKEKNENAENAIIENDEADNSESDVVENSVNDSKETNAEAKEEEKIRLEIEKEEKAEKAEAKKKKVKEERAEKQRLKTEKERKETENKVFDFLKHYSFMLDDVSEMKIGDAFATLFDKLPDFDSRSKVKSLLERAQKSGLAESAGKILGL